MKKLGTLAIFAVLGLVYWFGSEQSKPTVNETRSLTQSVKKIDLRGHISAIIKQGKAPSLIVYAGEGQLAEIKTEIRGDTLYIDNKNHMGRFEYFMPDEDRASQAQTRIEVTLPSLQEFDSAGLGGSEVSGFKGEQLHLGLSGKGSVKVVADYRQFDATMAGNGNLEINAANSESVDVRMAGKGHTTLLGHTKNMTAGLAGFASLEANQLKAQHAEVDLSGMGRIKVFASESIACAINGMGYATIYGNPKGREVSRNGIAWVSFD